jgi:DNA polymerase-3 subunit gamma/tau
VPEQGHGSSDSPVAEESSASTPQGTLTIDLVRAQWDQIRADVKAQSRRVDALLVSVDPVAVQGDTVVLSSAYPFHRNKLSEPDVQSIIESVIERLCGQQVRLSTVLHNEAPRFPHPVAGAQASIDQPASMSTLPDSARESPSNGQLSDDERRALDAAKNIFDAEEIDL